MTIGGSWLLALCNCAGLQLKIQDSKHSKMRECSCQPDNPNKMQLAMEVLLYVTVLADMIHPDRIAGVGTTKK